MNAISDGPRHRRVVHLIAPGIVGGLESVVRALLSESARRGAGATVVALRHDLAPHPYLETLRRDGVVVTEIQEGRRRYLAEARRVADRLVESGAELLHTHGYHADVVGVLAAKATGLPLVTTVHGFTGGGARNLAYEWAQCIAYHRFDTVIAVSSSVERRLRRRLVPSRRIRVLRNAWCPATLPLSRAAAREALGVPDGARRVGWVGRLSREKGPDVMIEAMRMVKDAELSIVGDGPMRAELERAARLAGVRVHWHGVRQDAARLMPAFDVLVISSRTEGIPIVLFEAIGAGVPVVATTVGGVGEVVSEGEARLVPPESPAALSMAVRAALDDVAGSTARATAARARVAAEFDARTWGERHDALYETLCGGGR